MRQLDADSLEGGCWDACCCGPSSGSGHDENGWERGGDGGSEALDEGVGMAGGIGGQARVSAMPQGVGCRQCGVTE